MKYLIRSAPQPLDAPVPQPDLSTPEKRGAYLVTIAGCKDCHTPQDAHGLPLPSMDFGWGFIMDGPWGYVASGNITPDPSGIPYCGAVLFMQAMRSGYVKARKLSQIMPWHIYRGMTDEDLAAMFATSRRSSPCATAWTTPRRRRFARSAGWRPEVGVVGIDNGMLPTPVECSASRKLWPKIATGPDKRCRFKRSMQHHLV